MPRLTTLTFLLLQSLSAVATNYNNSNNPHNFTFPSDPGLSGPPLDIIHAYFSQWPTGIAVSRSGRLFSNFPGGLDPANVNNGTGSGIFTVGELVSPSTEKAYPSLEMNTPPCSGGAVDLTDPENPVGCGSPDHLIAVQSVVIDSLDRLWILDTGRPMYTFPNGSVILLRSTYGGPKLIGVDLTTDMVFKTILFPPEVALPGDTYLNDVRFDLRSNITSSGEGVAYITDSSSTGQNGIIVVDLGTGESWRKLQRHPTVLPEEKFLPFVWGEPLYFLQDPGHPPTGNLTTTPPPGYIPFGSDGIAILPDGETLFYCPLASRNLYSVPTSLLRRRDDASDAELADSVTNHGETGNSDGLETDSNGVIYKGNQEANAVVAFNPKTGTTQTVVRDPRIGWVDTLSVAQDGYVYFTSNQLQLSGAVWSPGGDENQGDRRVRPFGLFRVPLLEGATKIGAPSGA